jgi:hypothetical protein
MKNLLIGAISSNYKVSDIYNWVKSSNNFENIDRVLFLYKTDTSPVDEVVEFLDSNSVSVISPDFDFYGNLVTQFEWNTANCDEKSSYNLVHNVRFFHIWNFLETTCDLYNSVLITDIRDVYFNKNPFDLIPPDLLIVSSEEIKYKDHMWNSQHLLHTLGIPGFQLLENKLVYNVGVFGGSVSLVKEISRDIYLIASGKSKVADQTAFNYLIQTKYNKQVLFTNLSHYFAVHLHVINEGRVKFNYEDAKQYCIVHQYDRILNWKQYE